MKKMMASEVQTEQRPLKERVDSIWRSCGYPMPLRIAMLHKYSDPAKVKQFQELVGDLENLVFAVTHK